MFLTLMTVLNISAIIDSLVPDSWGIGTEQFCLFRPFLSLFVSLSTSQTGLDSAGVGFRTVLNILNFLVRFCLFCPFLSVLPL